MKKVDPEQMSLFEDFFNEEKSPERPQAPFRANRKDDKECGNETDGCADIPVPETFESDEEEGKKQAPQSKKNVKKEFEDCERTDWRICYAGHQIPYRKEGKVKLSDIRRMLEKTFPELTADRTTMSFDEKKGIIVPIPTGAKKGGR